jgi:hypothetical protein
MSVIRIPDELDQPLGEYLQIAMRPIARSDGKATNFVVAKGLRGWMLIGNDARDETVLAGDVGLVFVQPDRAPHLAAPWTN